MANSAVVAELTAALVQQQVFIDQISNGQPINEETYRQMSNLSGQAHAAARSLAEQPGNTPHFVSTDDPDSMAEAVRNRHRTTAWVASLARDPDLETQGRALQALLLLRADGIFRIRELTVVPGFIGALVGYVGDAQAIFRAKMALELLQQITHNRVDAFRNAVVEAGGIERALGVVAQNTFHDRELSLRLLYNLASDASVHHAEMREKGVLEALVALVDASATQTLARLIIQKRLVETLHLFVVRKERSYIRDSHMHTPEQQNGIRAIVNAGAIQKLVDLFGAVRTQPEVQNETALLLAELCETHVGNTALGFCPSSVKDVGKACVAYLEGAGNKARGVCRLITNLASKSDLNRLLLSKAGVVEPLLGRARYTFSGGHDGGAAIAGDNAALAAARTLMLGALAALTTNSDHAIVESVVRNGGIGVCMYSLSRPGHVAKELSTAALLLTNLATCSRENTLAIVMAGGLRHCEDHSGSEVNPSVIMVKLLVKMVKALVKPAEPAAASTSAEAPAGHAGRKRTRSGDK